MSNPNPYQSPQDQTPADPQDSPIVKASYDALGWIMLVVAVTVLAFVILLIICGVGSLFIAA